MDLRKLLSRLIGGGGFIALLTLAVSGLFKIAAFGREAFIASHFGLSNLTDSYFAFQQFPLMLMTFMFGAFGLAFTPAYAEEKRRAGKVEWMPGLLLYGSLFGLVLTLTTAVLAPVLLASFTSVPSAHSAATLVILAWTFAPMIWLGIWAGARLADGRNISAMVVTGLPYLLMTLLLIVLYWFHKLDDLGLPISFLVGFALVGIYSLLSVSMRACKETDLRHSMTIWRMAGFRRFLGNLSASSLENLGYAANQLLLVFFLAKVGTGVVSANTCAMRLGLLGFSLLGQPLGQLVQAKLCAVSESEQADVFKKWLGAVATAVIALALLLYLGREPLVSMVYLRGKFSSVELGRVLEIMPAWIAYFVVASLNAIMARYLFATGRAAVYVRRQLFAYAAANAIRMAFWGRMTAPVVVWCSVAAEGCALLFNLRYCLQTSEPSLLQPHLAGVQEV